ncbi:MAG: gamma-glutamylcyclotransferase family protein [Dehalococcoidia bacterium]
MPRSLYFAYGSNMHLRMFRRRCPGAKPLGPALLRGYRIAFTRYDRTRKGGVADIVPEPDAEVWGALYEIDNACFVTLDKYENAPRAYRRELVRVIDDAAAEHESHTYIANQTGHFAPSRQYLGIIVQGARDHDLPEEYVQALQKTKTHA